MHWCCMVGNSGQDPHSVPPMNGVNIDWAHGGAGGGQKDDGGISDRFSGSPDLLFWSLVVDGALGLLAAWALRRALYPQASK